jgi:hypothetical protein
MCPSSFSRNISPGLARVIEVNYWLIVDDGELPADGGADADASVGIIPASHVAELNGRLRFVSDNDAFM